jgi:pimeloyl-ACP methyl ester carboxylesterase
MRVAYQFIEGRDPVVINSPVIGHQFGVVESISSWRERGDEFRGDNACAIVDYRGSGLSGCVEDTVLMSDFAFDFEAIAADLSDRELIVVGTASGIVPATEFVFRHPDRVRGLFMHGPGKNADLTPQNEPTIDESPETHGTVGEGGHQGETTQAYVRADRAQTTGGRTADRWWSDDRPGGEAD